VVSASSECPCGRTRAGCEYHDPALQPVDKAALRAAAKPIHFGGYPGYIYPAHVPTVAAPPPVVDLQDGGPLHPGSGIGPLTLTLTHGYWELLLRRHGQPYAVGWAFHQDPPGTWILADVPAGYDRAMIGLPVATQAPAPAVTP
jgi:hypothetical protein